MTVQDVCYPIRDVCDARIILWMCDTGHCFWSSSPLFVLSVFNIFLKYFLRHKFLFDSYSKWLCGKLDLNVSTFFLQHFFRYCSDICNMIRSKRNNKIKKSEHWPVHAQTYVCSKYILWPFHSRILLEFLLKSMIIGLFIIITIIIMYKMKDRFSKWISKCKGKESKRKELVLAIAHLHIEAQSRSSFMRVSV